MKQWLKEKEHLKMQQALDETKIKSLEMQVEQAKQSSAEAKQRAQESRQHADEIVKKSKDLRQASHLLY